MARFVIFDGLYVKEYIDALGDMKLSEKLYDYLLRPQQPGESSEDYSKRKAFSDGFKLRDSNGALVKSKRQEHGPYPYLRKFDFFMLDSYCDGLRLSFEELFKILDVKGFPRQTEQEKHIAQIVDDLPEEKASRLKSVLTYLAPEWWNNESGWWYGEDLDPRVSKSLRFDLCSSKKIHRLLKNKIVLGEIDKDEMPEVLKKAVETSYHALIPFENLPEVCAYLDIPLRWILGAKKTTVYGNKLVTQEILDLYTSLTDGNKYLIDDFLQRL